jgi:hypothetical protein
MSSAPEDEKRMAVRHPLTGDLTGSMVSAKSGSTVPCIAVDVSQTGMRIVLALDLNVGAHLILKMNDLVIPLEVVWCRKEASRKGYFACGLKRRNEAQDLEKVFTDIGWMDSGAKQVLSST